MTTKITIVNNALTLLADSPISDLNAASTRANLVNSIYDNIRDITLRKLPWNCAIKRVLLSPLVNAPSFDYAYQFQLPGDCMRVLSISVDDDAPEYKIEGRMLLTNIEAVKLRYIFRNDDPSSYDPGLTNVLTMELAKALAYPLTKSTAQVEMAAAMAKEAWREASAMDGLEGTPDDWFDNTLLSRRGV